MQFGDFFFSAPVDPGGRFHVHNDVLSRPVLSSGPFQENPAAKCDLIIFFLGGVLRLTREGDFTYTNAEWKSQVQ